jgi:hypothetical protein
MNYTGKNKHKYDRASGSIMTIRPPEKKIKIVEPKPKNPLAGKKYNVMKDGTVQFRMGGGKMKMSKYYKDGGTVITGRD